MIKRTTYLNKLISLKDKEIIKIITGIRRSGKSVLLNQYKDYLLSVGVKNSQIIYINFEDLEYENLLDYKKLYKYIIDKSKNKKTYVLLDEIQEVKNYEKAIDSLFIKSNFDIYLTGSNSKMLSSEISTLLSGRYVEIEILPFSFKEYHECVNGNIKDDFNEYYKYGGLPYLTELKENSQKLSYLEGIYNTIIVKDLIERKKISDIELFKDVVKYLIESIGNIVSTNKLSDTANSYGRKTNHVTISNYVDTITESFIAYKVYRYNIRGKERLKSLEKYYIVDPGFRSLVLSDKQYNLGSVLENIVFLELKRRNYNIYVGKIDSFEIDFIAENSDSKMYIQVSASVSDPTTFEREVKPLTLIKDNYPKYIISLDELPMNYNGIKQINIIDFLLGD